VTNTREHPLLVLALMCNKFGCLPSERLGILDRTVAMDLDCAAAVRLHLHEQDQEENQMATLLAGHTEQMLGIANAQQPVIKTEWW